MSDAPIRLAHLSDIHLSTHPLPWRGRDWFCKRMTGWFNLRCLGRGERFSRAGEVLAVLMAELRGPRRPDHIVFSGDATALGFPEEVSIAATALGVADPSLPPGLAVPGNHDYYLPRVAASGYFERCFAPWQNGERTDEKVYPFAQRAGPLWLIGVNSCTGNVWPGDASGEVGPAQRERLRVLLQRLAAGPRILVTHYPVGKANGQPVRPNHALRDLEAVVRIAAEGGVGLWLHGHEHHAYRLDDRKTAPFPVICVGSSTQRHTWGYHEYTVEGLELQVMRRVFDAEAGAFQEAAAYTLRLRH
ncbi:MAG: metallophosphoesterase [Gemmataceae bacterium]|nr:metallophosphoesterase [Gemmataceae bacterium]